MPASSQSSSEAARCCPSLLLPIARCNSRSPSDGICVAELVSEVAHRGVAAVDFALEVVAQLLQLVLEQANLVLQDVELERAIALAHGSSVPNNSAQRRSRRPLSVMTYSASSSSARSVAGLSQT